MCSGWIGCSSFVMVQDGSGCKGEVKPVYSTGRPKKGASPLTKANIDTTPAETNVEGIDIAFPRVSRIQ